MPAADMALQAAAALDCFPRRRGAPACGRWRGTGAAWSGAGGTPWPGRQPWPQRRRPRWLPELSRPCRGTCSRAHAIQLLGRATQYQGLGGGVANSCMACLAMAAVEAAHRVGAGPGLLLGDTGGGRKGAAIRTGRPRGRRVGGCVLLDEGGSDVLGQLREQRLHVALVAALGAGVGANLGHELGGHLQPVRLLVGGGDGAQDVRKAVGLRLRQSLACGASSSSDADTCAESQMHRLMAESSCCSQAALEGKDFLSQTSK